ncbi:MAG: porin, partial [Gammaproteobacteria bacterium]
DKAEAAVVAVEDARQEGTASGNWADKTSIGGYAELHYNNLDGDGGASDKKEIDLHRFVVFLGHEFNENIRFFSEVEIEHAVAGKDQVGEVEVEQAYVEFDLSDRHGARTGVTLLPVGILNETHEPPTFYGVERNPVENNIIPATWWAGSVGLFGEIAAGWSYDLVLHEGLKTSAADGYKPRAGRQKSGKAVAEDLAATARVKWTGMAGTEIAGSLQYQSDITQGVDPAAGSALLYELHAVMERGPFGLRALYAMWDLDGAGPASIGADEQDGFYIEPAYKLTPKLGVFVRYNQWDNAAGSSTDSEQQQWDFGLNWWPHPDVVLKADYQIQDNENGSEQDGFNLGVGVQF